MQTASFAVMALASGWIAGGNLSAWILGFFACSLRTKGASYFEAPAEQGELLWEMEM